MAKSLLAILKTPRQSKSDELDTVKRYAPHRRETAVKDFLRKLRVQAWDHPFDNTDAFTASKLKVFDRGANRYGNDNTDYNDHKMNMLPGDTGLEEGFRNWLKRRKKERKGLRAADEMGVSDIKQTSAHKEETEIEEGAYQSERSHRHDGGGRIKFNLNGGKKKFDDAEKKFRSSWKERAAKRKAKELEEARKGLKTPIKYGKPASLKLHKEDEEIDELSQDKLIDYTRKANQQWFRKGRKNNTNLAWRKIDNRGAKVAATEETIDELSRKTLSNYVSKTTKSEREGGKRRTKGLLQALDRLGGHRDTKHEGRTKRYHAEEAIDEKLGPNASKKDYIHDFVHSKNSKFSHDDKKQRIRRALGAWYKKHQNEDTAADILPYGERTNRLMAKVSKLGRKMPSWLRDKEQRKGQRLVGLVASTPKRRRSLREYWGSGHISHSLGKYLAKIDTSKKKDDDLYLAPAFWVRKPHPIRRLRRKKSK